MPDYNHISLKGALERINSISKPLYLPSIQRHFVWKPDRICKLFDSILSGYPIGTFLFWEVPDERRNEYAFYEFIRKFSEFNRSENDLAPRNPPPGITGILDGQQRLNSMYVALTGSYEQFKGGRGRARSSSNSYVTRHFYLNLLAETDEEGHWSYEFKFLSDAERDVRVHRHDEAWLLVGDSLHWQSEDDANKTWNDMKCGPTANLVVAPDDEERALNTIRRLHQVINKPDLITFYTVRDRELTAALEIFIRVNSGGITLNPMDLYFSTVAAYWKEGRSEVEKFLSEINATGKGFDLSIESLMLTCLCLSGAPIQLKVESFGPAHVAEIKKDWVNICDWLRKAASLLDSWSFSGNNKISVYAIIPVALAARAGYKLDVSAEDLRQLVMRSLISDFYSRGTRRRNRILTLVREFMGKDASVNQQFSLERFAQVVELPPGTSLAVSEETIDELLVMPIWHHKTFIVLSLLHGHHALHQQAFHKDHIHPHRKFESDSLDALNLSAEQKQRFRVQRDLLPNLQLLQGNDNQSKSMKHFEEWLLTFRPDANARLRYLDENDIPASGSLALVDFESFFDARKLRLRSRLVTMLRASSNP